jgi:mono/diheme cytochrome c family protein
MNKYSEIITKYISGQMDPAEKKDFEKQLTTNPGLKAEYELQSQVVKGIRRAGIKTEVKKGFKKGSFRAKLMKGAMTVLIAGLATTVVLVAKHQLSKEKEYEPIRYELNEENTKQWSDADKNIRPQVFQINTSADTVIETKEGIVFAIPANAFKNKDGDVNGTVELEVKEAMNPADILQAGLSTTSDGKLLETGGMFYLNARQDGENLSIKPDKGIHTSIPDKNPRKEMMLFEGTRTDDGQINWVNPKPFVNDLIPTDILSLNFYPLHFLDTLKSMGYDITNKKLTDSIYYSLSCYHGPENGRINEYNSETDLTTDSVKISSAEQAKLDAIFKQQSDSIATALTKELFNGGVTINNKRMTFYDGADLYRKNCSVCHSITDMKVTGPGLHGVFDRVPSESWMEKWIMNNEKLIKKGDRYANKIFIENGKAAMTTFEGQLNKDEVKAIINYIRQEGYEYDHAHSPCEIDPSRIHAIWDRKFNNTILATKQFEERLQIILGTCNTKLLEIYVEHLDRKMYELDSAAIQITGDYKLSDQFMELYKRKDGGVIINSSHMQKLKQYFEEKQKLYKEVTVATLKKLYSDENKKKHLGQITRTEHANSESIREDKVFIEEFRTNLKEAYRQLGKEVIINPPGGNFLTTTITTPGWKNVDAYVMESTTNRTTLDYTDRETGKKAGIKYEPFTLKVTDKKSYDKVFAYLLPDKLSSFQRMPLKEELFKENLNELFKYSAVVIGFKGEEIFMGQISEAKPGERTISLSKITKADLDQFRFQNAAAPIDMVSELNYQLFEQKENIRMKVIENREMIRERLLKVVFPCYITQQTPERMGGIENH